MNAMRAVIFDAVHSAQVGAWQSPVAGPDDVIVRNAAVGICAGDMYIYQGKNPYARMPIIGGHEICGVVSQVGAHVTAVAPGQLVVVEPFIGCGRCYACRVGKSNCCSALSIIGVHRPGGFAEQVVVPADHVHVVPDGLSPLWASFAEPVAIGVQACRRGSVGPGDRVLILGAGPIGLALVEVAAARGAQVYITDIAEERLAFAASLGATPLPGGAQLLPAVLALTNGEGMPVVIEATGRTAVMAATVDLVAAGGRVVIVGLVKAGAMVELPGLDLTRKEMTIVGSRASVNCFPEALSLLASGAIRYPKVATAFDLWDAPTVFAKLDAAPGKVHKGVFMLEEE
jgi:L-gulonate 5-dehydrogenase